MGYSLYRSQGAGGDKLDNLDGLSTLYNLGSIQTSRPKNSVTSRDFMAASRSWGSFLMPTIHQCLRCLRACWGPPGREEKESGPCHSAHCHFDSRTKDACLSLESSSDRLAGNRELGRGREIGLVLDKSRADDIVDEVWCSERGGSIDWSPQVLTAYWEGPQKRINGISFAIQLFPEHCGYAE